MHAHTRAWCKPDDVPPSATCATRRERMSPEQHPAATDPQLKELTMTDTNNAASNRLPVLAAEIRRAHADVHDAAMTAAQRAIDAGHALIEAKELVAHGQWLPWLRENCALSERTAQLYMK